jgi:O-acetyl-ADP-ribose deacetylase (regulator of RNase III)
MEHHVTVSVGNIVKQNDCDGIVNSANQNLRAGSGVCGAIYRAAGSELEPCSMQFAPLELGNAIVTPGFLLPNRWIIHVRGPKYHFDPEPSANLARAMENVLRVAEENGIHKIAVPAVSMGIYAYPPEEAVQILVAATFRALPNLRFLEEIRFVVLETKLATLFQCVIADAKDSGSGDLKRAVH